MVPLRALAEDFGFTVSWAASARTVTLTKGSVSRTIAIGSAAFEGGTLEAAPVIQGGRTFVPLNFTETGLGACYLDDNGNITKISRGYACAMNDINASVSADLKSSFALDKQKAAGDPGARSLGLPGISCRILSKNLTFIKKPV